jgi:hypothetical protein
MAKTKRKARKRPAVRAGAPSLANNVDTSARPADRAAQMLSLLEVTESDLDTAQSASFRNNVTRFLLHVSWHEGAKLTRREQMQGGPARSFFQFEMGRAKDAGDLAIEKGLVGKLAAVSGRSELVLRTAINGLSSGSSFPDGNLIRTLLTANDLFGCYLARIAFKRISAPIPRTTAGHATYWYEHWKVTGGDPDTLKKVFTREANEVDALV